MWVDFKADCDELKLSVDDIFRYYPHMIRGIQSITSNEKRLREFFSNEPFSPLKTLNYKEVLEDLNKILSILKYMNKERGDSNDVGIWLQIINAYTNQYPTYALVVYLYYNNVDTDEEKHRFISFLQSLIRYCFYMGSTTSVKFNIYNMIKVIANKGEIDANYTDVAPDYFSHLGRLQNAFALLAYYLDSKEPIPTRFTVDKIVNLRDEDLLGEDWHYQYLSDICNSIGNLVVMDLPKRYNSLTDKYDYYKLSKNEYVKNILTSKTFTFDKYKERNRHLKMLLANFFNKPEEND